MISPRRNSGTNKWIAQKEGLWDVIIFFCIIPHSHLIDKVHICGREVNLTYYMVNMLLKIFKKFIPMTYIIHTIY